MLLCGIKVEIQCTISATIIIRYIFHLDTISLEYCGQMPASFSANLISEKGEYSSSSKMVQLYIQQKIQWLLYVTFLATT
jgi:hypothetical protein